MFYRRSTTSPNQSQIQNQNAGLSSPRKISFLGLEISGSHFPDTRLKHPSPAAQTEHFVSFMDKPILLDDKTNETDVDSGSETVGKHKNLSSKKSFPKRSSAHIKNKPITVKVTDADVELFETNISDDKHPKSTKQLSNSGQQSPDYDRHLFVLSDEQDLASDERYKTSDENVDHDETHSTNLELSEDEDRHSTSETGFKAEKHQPKEAEKQVAVGSEHFAKLSVPSGHTTASHRHSSKSRSKNQGSSRSRSTSRSSGSSRKKRKRKSKTKAKVREDQKLLN